MNKTLSFAVACVLGFSPMAQAQSDDIAALQQQINQLKQEYEGRIQDLEQRLQQVQSSTIEEPQPTAPSPRNTKNSSRQSVSSGTAFNPAISVILDGSYYNDNDDGKGGEKLESLDGIHNAHGHSHDHGHDDHGHSHGGMDRGFNLNSVEMAISATVDPYFDAKAQIVFSEDSVEVEEAYLLTRGLPAGLQVKGGKFLSDIGYMNKQHTHDWDFSDAALPYKVLLGGHGLGDIGLQLSWLPELPVYTRLGMELFQGRNEKMGALVGEHHYEFEGKEYELTIDKEKSAPRMWTLFAKFAPDLGYNHALQGGLFYVRSNQLQEFHGDDAHVAGDSTHALQGKSWLAGTDWVYKYDSAGSYGQGDVRIQAEYLYQVKDLNVAYHASKPAVVGATRKFTEDGLYLQAVYGFAPRWEAGVRYEVVGLTNKKESANKILDEWESSDRWGLNVTFRPTEYSLLRAQFTRGNFSILGDEERINQFWLQYQLSLGVHGAHAF
ncbi:TonB-dependent receptor [Candidatus Albibeggiatoa sp. nov. NOAA]|uniref:TonB-dependent receptor n=1 Tax=Candidatus Albibeggiatoa sp. nov. NOAA TaxID=3162724 RepID=UPI0032F18A36|nr:TonB-dependent receptor [Thiotrichaceae bacterium]